MKTLAEAAKSSTSGPAESVEISEEKIDYVLHLLHEADPVSLLRQVIFPTSGQVVQNNTI